MAVDKAFVAQVRHARKVVEAKLGVEAQLALKYRAGKDANARLILARWIKDEMEEDPDLKNAFILLASCEVIAEACKEKGDHAAAAELETLLKGLFP